MKNKIGIGLILAAVVATAAFAADLNFYGSTAGTVTCTNNTTGTLDGPVIDVTKYDEIAIGAVVSGDYTGAESTTNWINLGFGTSIDGVNYTPAKYTFNLTNTTWVLVTNLDVGALSHLKLVSYRVNGPSNATVSVSWGGKIAK